jgi:hypothetical protein
MAMFSDRLKNYAERRCYSEAVLGELRDILADTLAGEDILLTTNGSFARREACPLSDLDFFIICRSGDEQRVQTLREKVLPHIARVVPKPPAVGGAFATVEALDTMLANIGGQHDPNDKITRRMLFLLEGEWLFNEPFFRHARERLLRRYVRSTMSPDKIARFLLNDVIRYYRTISVDFEHKTTEAEKPWGTRYIKLVFPRKLLYFSGILAVAETRDLPVPDKLDRLASLLDLPMVERIHQVCGDAALDALSLYDEFLRAFAQPETRATLDRTTEADRETSPVFRALKDRSMDFTVSLHELLGRTYGADHPIHLALFA